MNVKRKVIALLSLVIMLFSMVGCSNEGLALIKELNRVNAWETNALAVNVSLSGEAEGTKLGIKVDVTGWVNQKTLQGEMEINIKEIEVDGEVVDTNLSPFKVLIDHEVVYISKSLFTEAFTLEGQPIPKKLNDIQADYIGFETATTESTPRMDANKANDLLMKLIEKAKMDVTVKQDKKSFTIEMNSDQLVDATVAILNAAMDDIDALNAIVPTGMTQEEVDKEKEEIQAMLVAAKNEIKPSLSGINLKLTYNFEDNKYTSGVDMNFEITDAGQKAIVQMKVNGTTSNLGEKEFILPKKVVKLTMEEFYNLMGDIE